LQHLDLEDLLPAHQCPPELPSLVACLLVQTVLAFRLSLTEDLVYPQDPHLDLEDHLPLVFLHLALEVLQFLELLVPLVLLVLEYFLLDIEVPLPLESPLLALEVHLLGQVFLLDLEVHLLESLVVPQLEWHLHEEYRPEWEEDSRFL